MFGLLSRKPKTSTSTWSTMNEGLPAECPDECDDCHQRRCVCDVQPDYDEFGEYYS